MSLSFYAFYNSVVSDLSYIAIDREYVRSLIRLHLRRVLPNFSDFVVKSRGIAEYTV